MRLSRYLKVYPSRIKADHFLLFSTLRSATALVPARTLDAANAGKLQGPERETLERLGMLVPDLDQEREQVRSMLERVCRNSKAFKVTVVLNLDCNLDCSYCYEGLFRHEQYMTESTGDLLVETLERDYMAKGKDVSITFYGGEPLLSQDLITRVSASLQKAANAHQVQYGFALVTNGTLLNRETAERLIPYGLKAAKFTLDGPKEIHDRQRPYSSGSGSFDTILNNLADVCDLLEIQLGGNFLQDNYRDFPLLLDELAACGVTPEKLMRVQFSPITAQAGCADQSAGCVSSSDPWLIEAFPYLREEIMKRGFATTRTAASACIVEFPNTLVVNYDGTLYKCPAFMGDESLAVGTLAEGIKDYTESHALGNWQNEECLDCSYLPLCFGGCRFLTQLQGKPLTELDCKREFLDSTLETMILQNIAHPPTPKAPATKAK